MSRSIFALVTLTIALTAGANAANAAGYDSSWQEQTSYRTTSTVGYDDGYSVPRVTHRVRYTNSAYTVSRRVTPAPMPCH